MLGYAFWPREYGRQFWSHGPRDILRAMTAPTAAFAAQADDVPRRRRRLPTALVSAANAAQSDRAICIARVKDQAMRPLDRIDETIRLTPEQQQGLEELRTTVRAAIDGEAAACRGDLPATQPERLRAMIDGLWAMRYAEFRIRPALETFHGSLTDAQKAQLAEEPQTVGSSEAAPATATPAAICGEAVTGRRQSVRADPARIAADRRAAQEPANALRRLDGDGAVPDHHLPRRNAGDADGAARCGQRPRDVAAACRDEYRADAGRVLCERSATSSAGASIRRYA